MFGPEGGGGEQAAAESSLEETSGKKRDLSPAFGAPRGAPSVEGALHIALAILDSLHSICLLVLFASCISASIFMGLFFLFY